MPARKTIAEALEVYISPEPNSGCFLWTGQCNRKGYGVISAERKTQAAHRASYEFYVNKIPDGLQLDHLCRTRCCVNPRHLEPVTLQENVRRGEVGRLHRNKTHCPKGHPYDKDNTGKSNGERYCKECRNSVRREIRSQRTLPRMSGEITFNGESHNLTEWAKIIGISLTSLSQRFRSGQTLERALRPKSK